MPWNKEKTIPSLNNKSDKIKEVFAEAANAALSRGLSEEESVFAGLAAVKNYEKKHAVKKAVVENKSKPLHLQALFEARKTTVIETETQADQEQQKELIAASWDSNNRLVLTFNDGSKIISSQVPTSETITKQVVVAAPKVVDYLIFDTQTNIPVDQRVPGMVTWNIQEDCLDVVQKDGSTLQPGLEQYIEIYNNTSSTLYNGQVVCFSGVSGEEVPTAIPLTASPEFMPLYIIGVMTNDVLAGQRGRATVFGKVRNLDTTGSSVGETWVQGDLLWAHPTVAGALTNHRPTAPNPAISIAAVLKVSSSEGLILVRPTIFPRLYYGKYLSNQIQAPAAENTPYAVSFNITEIQSGFVLENGTRLKALSQGLYSFDFRLQVTSTNSSNKEIYIWARKNSVDVPNSTSKVSLLGNAVEVAPSWNFVYSMQAGDYFELMYACSSTAVLINAPAGTSFCPSTPSAVIKVTQIDL